MTPADIYHARRAVKLAGSHPLHITTQRELAEALGVSVRTLEAWEQGRRQPSGAAAALLKLIALKPELLAVLQSGKSHA